MKKLFVLLVQYLWGKVFGQKNRKQNLLQVESDIEQSSKSHFSLKVSPQILVAWSGLLLVVMALIDFLIRFWFK